MAPTLDGLPEVHYHESFRDEALAAQKAAASAVSAAEVVEPEVVVPKKTRKTTKKA